MYETTHLRQRPEIETHILPDGSFLLFDPATDKGYALNVAGSLVWDYCDGAMTGAEVSREMADLLPQHGDMATVTDELLSELLALGLLTPVPSEGSQWQND
jgi:hypothetical protein